MIDLVTVKVRSIQGKRRGKGGIPSVFLSTRSTAPEQPLQVIVMSNLKWWAGDAIVCGLGMRLGF